MRIRSNQTCLISGTYYGTIDTYSGGPTTTQWGVDITSAGRPIVYTFNWGYPCGQSGSDGFCHHSRWLRVDYDCGRVICHRYVTCRDTRKCSDPDDRGVG